ncbi:hypothetical protein [Pedobacter sp.]|uniref:hypothetical protein n=1 Tax=Pedobacter sp. TaxID=1411316 RepID=UPI003D7FF09F
MMRIAYIAEEEPIPKPKKLTKKEILHRAAVETLTVKKAHDRIRANEMFAAEIKEIEVLEAQLAELKLQNNTF